MKLEPDPPSKPTPNELVRRWAAAYNSHDAQAAAALYHEAVTNIQFPWENPVRGRDAMKTVFLRIFEAFPDIRVDIENTFVEGDWAIIEWTFSGTMRGNFAGHPPSGRPFKLRGCEFFQLKEGTIFVQHGYWDKATMFRQLGL